MSDLHLHNRDPNDPYRNDPNLASAGGADNTAWGWIAAAVFVLVIVAVGFGLGHKPGENGINTASNDMSPPAVTRIPPPVPMPAPTMAPAPATPSAPVTPAPANGQ
ncbi:MAG TPA: hypothetical protein VH206_06550 [Xanthobacteraceae bacterium]|jgi:hypothetical protein|nr:hypothetical protein [Xanthobacteraceae bacterium]